MVEEFNEAFEGEEVEVERQAFHDWLDDWLEETGLTYEEVQEIIIDAVEGPEA
jgi:hypothetical protein